MKNIHLRNFYVSAVISLFPLISYAQYDSIFVKINSDTVTIWSINSAVANCLGRYVATITISNDTIMIIETDTSSVGGTCTDCLKDFAVSITGLPSGTYHARMYQKELNPLWISLMDSAQFTFVASGSPLQSFSNYVSNCHKLDAVNEHPDQPAGYSLLVNYPNPFNPLTVITYSIPSMQEVTLKIYDVAGRVVRTLVDGRQVEGTHVVPFDASRLANGVYFYRITAGTFTAVKKLVVLK